LEVEPVESTADFEKVDIRLRFNDGRVRLTQVKHSRNPFGKPQVDSWVKELAVFVNDQTVVELVLLGTGTTTLSQYKSPPGVTVRFETMATEVHLRALANMIGSHSEERLKSMSHAAARRAAYRFVGTVIAQSQSGATWTPARLSAEAMRSGDSLAEEHASDVTDLDVTWRRTLDCQENLVCHEYIRYQFVNRQASSIELDLVRIKLTDPGVVKVEAVCNGFATPAPEWAAGNSADNAVFELGVRVDHVLKPGASITVGALLVRDGLFSRVGKTIAFDDPLLGVPEAYSFDVQVVFPRAGRVSAEGAQCTSRMARWMGLVGKGGARHTAHWSPMRAKVDRRAREAVADARTELLLGKL
jgi:hypothetical protein